MILIRLRSKIAQLVDDIKDEAFIHEMWNQVRSENGLNWMVTRTRFSSDPLVFYCKVELDLCKRL